MVFVKFAATFQIRIIFGSSSIDSKASDDVNSMEYNYGHEDLLKAV